MFLLGYTQDLERLPKKFESASFELEIDSLDKLVEFSASRNLPKVDLDKEQETLDTKAKIFGAAVSQLRLQSFASILKGLSTADSKLLEKLVLEPDLTSKQLIAIHDQFMKRYEQETKTGLTPIPTSTKNIYNTTADNRQVVINKYGEPENSLSSPLDEPISIEKEIEALDPKAQKRILYMMESMTKRSESTPDEA